MFFDAGRMPEPGSMAVVMGPDGRLAVEVVHPIEPGGYRPAGFPMVKIDRAGPLPRGILSASAYVVLIGAVAESM